MLLVPTSSDPFLKPPLDRVLNEKNIQHGLNHHQQNVATDPIGINTVPHVEGYRYGLLAINKLINKCTFIAAQKKIDKTLHKFDQQIFTFYDGFLLEIYIR